MMLHSYDTEGHHDHLDPNWKTLRRDCFGVLGMPFRFLIALVTVALVVPAIMAGWTSLDYMQTESIIQGEISRILVAAQRYLQAGSGGEVVDVSFRGGSLTRVEYVIFGDIPGGPYQKTTRYKLTGGQEVLMSSRNPSVYFANLDGSALTLSEGRYSLLVECEDGFSITLRLV